MGHKDNNPNFLYNFYNAVSRHEYVTSNTYSTPIFYSLFMKKKAFIYGNNMHDNIKWHYIEPESKKKKKLELTFMNITKIFILS